MAIPTAKGDDDDARRLQRRTDGWMNVSDDDDNDTDDGKCGDDYPDQATTTREECEGGG